MGDRRSDDRRKEHNSNEPTAPIRPNISGYNKHQYTNLRLPIQLIDAHRFPSKAKEDDAVRVQSGASKSDARPGFPQFRWVHFCHTGRLEACINNNIEVSVNSC